MNQAISVELQFFLVSVLSGGILLLVYDILRILRRLMKHDSFFVALEDLIYWVGASLFIFAMMYKENDGIIRGFSILGMLIGMVLYHYIIDDILVNLIVKLIKTLISPFVFVINKIKGFLKLIWKQGKKVVNFFTRQLKKRTKSVKITMDKRKQTSTARKQKHLEEKNRKKSKQTEKKQAKKANSGKKQSRSMKQETSVSKPSGKRQTRNT